MSEERRARVGALRAAGFTLRVGAMTEATEGVCPSCPHPFDDHEAIADFTAETAGGVTYPREGRLVCPDCGCMQTWGVTTKPAPLPWDHPHRFTEGR